MTTDHAPPTQAEIDAGALALHLMLGEDHTMRGCEHMAGKALAAAEAVRAAAVDTMTEAELLAGLDPYINADGTCTCHVCQAYRALQATDQRMTQTHAPLAGWKRTRDQSG